VESSPDEGLSPAASVHFRALQRRFVAGLAARWTDIRDAPDLQSMCAALHRLRGSAGSYGFALLGQVAGELEVLAGRAAGADLAPRLALLEEEIRRLENQWENAPGTGPV
jgi:hypothetical protein